MTGCYPSPRDSLVAVCDELGFISIVDAARDSACVRLPVNRGSVGALRWSPDGRRLAVARSAPDSGTWVVTWSVWNVDSRTKRFETQDGRFLVLDGHGMSCLQVLDGKTVQPLHEIPLQ